LVGLASSFIVGNEVIPLDAEKHKETPFIEGIDPACIFLGPAPSLAQQSEIDPYRKIGNIQVL